jgi:AAA family ATPase
MSPLYIYLPDVSGSGETEVTSCVLQPEGFITIAPRKNPDDEHDNSNNNNDNLFVSKNVNTIRVHPLVYKFLSLAAREISINKHRSISTISRIEQDALHRNIAGEMTMIEIQPLPIPPWISLFNNPKGYLKTEDHYFAACSIKTVHQLPTHSHIRIKCLYGHDSCITAEEYGNNPRHDHSTKRLQRTLDFSLQGRLVKQGTFMVLTTSSPNGTPVHVVAIVKDIANAENVLLDDAHVYRVCHTDFSLHVMTDENGDDEIIVRTPSERFQNVVGNESYPHFVDCPGYESQVEELVCLLSMKHPKQTCRIAPSGILLTGCTGVGKTRMAACAACRLQQSKSPMRLHWFSVHDLVLQASWATEEDLFRNLKLQSTDGTLLVIILDDLDAVGSLGESKNSNDLERQLVRNSIIQMMDRLVASRVAILGIAKAANELPIEFTRVARFEKEVSMLPPSQGQRESILFSLLSQQSCQINKKQCQKWSELLASITPGYVALDLRHLCADAYNRSLARTEYSNCPEKSTKLTWEDLSEAARNSVPSQLAALDVKKPASFLELCDVHDWHRVHELSWKSFAGYEIVKKRLYRTVVIPWHRLLRTEDSNSDHKILSNTAPYGVLFHGPSGCGKTLAANCLGSSLGLPMIKVRAADVLDKWLGGSEAAIRSLFQRARAASPSILFFDEIDAIANNRANVEEGGDSENVMSRLLSTLLNEMDGVSSGPKDKILIVACTNRLSTLDSALLRPGRLDEHIHLQRPSKDDALQVLKHFFSKVPLDDGLNLELLSHELFNKGATGSEIEGFCRETVFRALRRYSNCSTHVSIKIQDTNDAMEVVLRLKK